MQLGTCGVALIDEPRNPRLRSSQLAAKDGDEDSGLHPGLATRRLCLHHRATCRCRAILGRDEPSRQSVRLAARLLELRLQRSHALTLSGGRGRGNV